MIQLKCCNVAKNQDFFIKLFWRSVLSLFGFRHPFFLANCRSFTAFFEDAKRTDEKRRRLNTPVHKSYQPTTKVIYETMAITKVSVPKILILLALGFQLFLPAECTDQRIELEEISRSNIHVSSDELNCSEDLPTLHMRNTDLRLRKGHTRIFNAIKQKYTQTMPRGSLIEQDILMTLPEGNFVLWGEQRRALYDISFYNNDTVVVDMNGYVGGGSSWRIVAPQTKEFSTLKEYHTLKGDHVVFLSHKFEIFAHFFLDYLGYIVYLREVMPESTRFLFADVDGSSRTRLETLDPEFAARVDWIQCANSIGCNQLIRIQDGSLTLLRPKSWNRHIDLLLKARAWILEKKPPKKKSLTNRTIVYYSRNQQSASHGRVIDPEQEALMLDIIKSNMVRYGRDEQLVVFDGTVSLEEQIDLFQSANVVIGAHGGGMANLIFLLPSESCKRRPKVLEFLSNELTPDVQGGSMAKTYFNLYTMCPWADYHHVFYVPPSSSDTTYVNLEDFEEAVKLILGEDQEKSSQEITV